jgi:hypothetical protein
MDCVMLGVVVGNHRRREIATNREIKQAAHMILGLAQLFARLENAAELIGGALEEVGRYREAIKVSGAPLDWKSFVRDIAKHDPALARAMAGSMATRFTLGHLHISAPDGFDYATLSINKERLGEMLRARFGAKFKLQIRNQE